MCHSPISLFTLLSYQKDEGAVDASVLTSFYVPLMTYVHQSKSDSHTRVRLSRAGHGCPQVGPQSAHRAKGAFVFRRCNRQHT